MEEIYIGTQIVTAEPMPGDQDGYKVRYEDGYVSWSPKKTFERAYRKMTLKEAELVAATHFVIPDDSGDRVKPSSHLKTKLKNGSKIIPR